MPGIEGVLAAGLPEIVRHNAALAGGLAVEVQVLRAGVCPAHAVFAEADAQGPAQQIATPHRIQRKEVVCPGRRGVLPAPSRVKAQLLVERVGQVFVPINGVDEGHRRWVQILASISMRAERANGIGK